MAVVIAVVNQKGGVGKTTTAISLGAALGERGLRVLLVDADPQANATSALGQPRNEDGGLYDALVGERPLDGSLVETGARGLSLAPATLDLAGAEVELVPVMAREFRMRRALTPLRERFDVILIDCPPSLGLLTVNALAAADEALAPVQAEYLALEGLLHLSQTISLVQQNLNPELRLLGHRAHDVRRPYQPRAPGRGGSASPLRQHLPGGDPALGTALGGAEPRTDDPAVRPDLGRRRGLRRLADELIERLALPGAEVPGDD